MKIFTNITRSLCFKTWLSTLRIVLVRISRESEDHVNVGPVSICDVHNKYRLVS